MSVLGICVAPSGYKGRPVVSAVLLDGTRASPVVLTAFDLRTAEVAAPEQIAALAKALASKATGLTFDAAVIRIADAPPTANRRAAATLRQHIEGALVFVLRQQLDRSVILRTGRDFGIATSTSKAAVETQGKQVDGQRPQAAAAALSELPQS